MGCKIWIRPHKPLSLRLVSASPPAARDCARRAREAPVGLRSSRLSPQDRGHRLSGLSYRASHPLGEAPCYRSFSLSSRSVSRAMSRVISRVALRTSETPRRSSQIVLPARLLLAWPRVLPFTTRSWPRDFSVYRRSPRGDRETSIPSALSLSSNSLLGLRHPWSPATWLARVATRSLMYVSCQVAMSRMVIN